MCVFFGLFVFVCCSFYDRMKYGFVSDHCRVLSCTLHRFRGPRFSLVLIPLLPRLLFHFGPLCSTFTRGFVCCASARVFIFVAPIESCVAQTMAEIASFFFLILYFSSCRFFVRLSRKAHFVCRTALGSVCVWNV